MRDYPYTCLEQRVSRAVALHDAKLWSGVVAELPSFVDSDGLLKYFPMMQQGSDVLTSYVLAVTNEAGLKIPDPVEEQMRGGLQGFVEGKIIRDESIQTVDLPMRKLAAIEALARVGKIEPAMLGSISIEPNLWPDSAVLDWWSILLRTESIPDRQKRIEEAEQIIRARLNSQGTAMHFSSDPRSIFWWLMVSPAENMARLTLLLLDNKLWNDDISRVTSGMIAMQIRGNWGTTVANAWGTLATEKFAAAYESQPVTGETIATLNAAKQVLDWAEKSEWRETWTSNGRRRRAICTSSNPEPEIHGRSSRPMPRCRSRNRFRAATRLRKPSRRLMRRTPADGGRAISSASISRSTRKAI